MELVHLGCNPSSYTRHVHPESPQLSFFALRGFEERILRRLTARSEFVKAQLECLGDDFASGRLQIPEETGSLWIDCMLSTPAQLKATDDETLAAYLKVCSLCTVVRPLLSGA